MLRIMPAKNKNILFISVIFKILIKQEAQTFAIHLTAHHKPLLNMGMLRPRVGTVPILRVCSFLAVVIVRLLSNMSLHSLQNAVTKVVKKI